MACNTNFEFDCPQFYDFCNGVEDNTIDMRNLGGDSPDFENKFNLKSKNLLKNRFAMWNNKLSTPVIRSSFVNKLRQNNETDYEKLNQRKKRLSKSEGSLNIKGVCVNNLKNNLYCPSYASKKSLSESDIRPKKKFPVTPKKVPATPMCLKRTMRKEKSKKLKTTEEIELEKIAELQRLTLQHLRFNEQNMKRMKLKPKPLSVPKLAPLKDEKKEKSLGVKEFQKDLESVVKKLGSNKNMRFFSNKSQPRNRLAAVSSESDLEPTNSPLVLQPSLLGLLNEVQETVDEKVVINELSFKKKLGHSGLFFHMNHSKNAALKPFNFHDRVKESGPSYLSKSSIKVKENEMVNKVQYSYSFHMSHLKIRNDKENMCVEIEPKTDAGIRKKPFKF